MDRVSSGINFDSDCDLVQMAGKWKMENGKWKMENIKYIV